MKGLRFIWRCTRVIDGTILLFKEFIDDGSSYDEIRDSNTDLGWWTGEERRIPRVEFWSGHPTLHLVAENCDGCCREEGTHD